MYCVQIVFVAYWILKIKLFDSKRRPGMRKFRKANSGVVFEFYQKKNKNATPVIFLLASDVSFSGQHRTHHPIYRESIIYSKLQGIVYVNISGLFVRSVTSASTRRGVKPARSMGSCRLYT